MAALVEQQHGNTTGCDTKITVRENVGTTSDAEIVVNSASECSASETERGDESKVLRTHRRKKSDKAPKQTPVESVDIPDDYEERLCKQAAAEGLDPFLESIPEANREVVVARLFEDFRSATTKAKYIDNGRWRDYGAYADRGYYVIAAHATIMALHRQCPESFTTLPAHAQELCLGLLLQLVRLAPLVTNPEGNDGTETAKDVLARLSGAARSYSASEQPPFLVRLLREQTAFPEDTLQHAWAAKWTVELGEILGCGEAAAWLRGIETARGFDKLLAKATQPEEGGTSSETTRVQKGKRKRVREGPGHVRQAPAKKSKAAVVGGEKVRSKARVEAPVVQKSEEHERATQDSEADGAELEAEEERIRAQVEELERAKKGFEAERAEIEGEKASLRAQVEEMEGGKKGAEAEKRRLERATANIRAQYEELERAKKSFQAEREKFEKEKASLRARLEELERVDAAETARNDERDQSEELKKALKAREKELKRKWKVEKKKLEDEKKTLEEQVRGYDNVNEVLKKELKKHKPE